MSAGKRAVYIGFLLAFSVSSATPSDACGTLKPCDCQHSVARVPPIPESPRSCHGERGHESSKATTESPCCGQCWLSPAPIARLEPRPVSLLTPEAQLIFTTLLESTFIYVPLDLSAMLRSSASERGQPPPGFLTLFRNLSPPSFLA